MTVFLTNPNYFNTIKENFSEKFTPIFNSAPFFTENKSFDFWFASNIDLSSCSIYGSPQYQWGTTGVTPFNFSNTFLFNNNFPTLHQFSFPGFRNFGKLGKKSSNTSLGKTIGNGSITEVPGIDYSLFGVNTQQIKRLTPLMQQKIEQLYKYAKQKGWTITITSGYRSTENQRYLYETVYADQPGRAAKPGTSPHEFGWAVDLQVNGSSMNSETRELGLYAKSIGMRWGGDFNSVKEPWHFDIKNIPLSSSSSSSTTGQNSGQTKRINGSLSLTPTSDYAAIYNGTYTGDYVNTGSVVHFRYADANIAAGTLKPSAQSAFSKMAAAMKRDLGFTLSFTSGYRNSTSQLASLKNHTYNSDVSVMKNRFKSVAPQGYSEHHTGYACDITINGNRSRETSAWKTGQLKQAYDWLNAHAHEYGFEQSFKANNKQGVIEEQWHWRFVGDDDSRRVFENARRYEGIIT